MNIAFAGLRHSHIFVLYNMAKSHALYHVTGAFEENGEARQFAQENGVVCNYTSFDELLGDPEVEAVALGGCYGDRGGMAIRALKAGKHVIADKPLCTSLCELDEIERLAREKSLFVSCMFTMRFEQKINAVKALVENGTLGEIRQVYFGGQHPLQYGRRPMWYFEENKHGGVINDIAIHGVDVLSYALHLDVDKIEAARVWNAFAEKQPQFKDSAQIMLTATNGAGILADVSYAIPNGVEFSLPYYWQFYVWGSKGVIRFSLNEKQSYYYFCGETEAHPLEESSLKTDYLTDFHALVTKQTAQLSMEEVFTATRTTLQIQKQADAKN